MSATLLDAPEAEKATAPVATWTGAKQEDATRILFRAIWKRIVTSDEFRSICERPATEQLDRLLEKLVEMVRCAFLEELAARRWRLWTNLFTCHHCHQIVEDEARQGREYLEAEGVARAAAMIAQAKVDQARFLEQEAARG